MSIDDHQPNTHRTDNFPTPSNNHTRSNAYNFPAIRAAFAQAYARLHNLILHPPPGKQIYS